MSPAFVIKPNLGTLGQTLRASVGGPRNFGDGGPRLLTCKIGACLISEKHAPPPQVSRRQIWSLWVKRLARNHRDHPEKFDPIRVPPFKIAQGHLNQHGSSGHPWLVLHITMRLSRNVSETTGDICKISPPLVFNPPTAAGVSVGIL